MSKNGTCSTSGAGTQAGCRPSTPRYGPSIPRNERPTPGNPVSAWRSGRSVPRNRGSASRSGPTAPRNGRSVPRNGRFVPGISNPPPRSGPAVPPSGPLIPGWWSGKNRLTGFRSRPTFLHPGHPICIILSQSSLTWNVSRDLTPAGRRLPEERRARAGALWHHEGPGHPPRAGGSGPGLPEFQGPDRRAGPAPRPLVCPRRRRPAGQ